MQRVELKPSSADSPKARRHADDIVLAPPSPRQETRKISRETLVNRLNYLHFQSAPLTIILTHRKNGRNLRLNARPDACLDEIINCTWESPLPDGLDRGDFGLEYLEVPHGHHILQVDLKNPELTKTGMTCRLPEICCELTSRHIRRRNCDNIAVEVIQNGAIFSGTLEDFSAAAFRVELQTKPPQTFQWLNRDEPLTIMFRQNDQNLLTTSGQLLRSHGKRDRHSVVITPTLLHQRRFPPKKHRTRRLELNPAPEAVFTHPLTKQLIRLDVTDLSGAGMAVAESPHEAQLLPGLLLEKLELRLAESFSLSCQAQVVYCQNSEEAGDGRPLRCGLALLDMNVSDHTRLMALLHRADNRSKGVCPKIDLDQLWEFFFASGFIYPKKYQSLQGYREEFKATYAKLYDSAPEIARHFIYQENSRIVGHMAMLRHFSNSWMIHHHAADSAHSRSAGLETLQLVGEAVNESQALYSSHMDYVMCFFRPENRFPQRVFGGVADHYNDPSRCSIDTFSYFHFSKELDATRKNDNAWQLVPATEDDLLDLEANYHNSSGGLMLQGMDLTPQQQDDSSLQESYGKAGFQREKSLFALKHNGETVALLMALQTEVGLNLSNLTNAITVIVLDNKALPRDAFFTAVSKLASKYPQQEVPVLTYPTSYTESQSIEVEKNYNLWVIDCRHLDPYFEFCSNYFKRMRCKKEDKAS